MSDMTKEQTEAYIAALIRERDGYLRAGRAYDASVVDAELDRVGHKAAAPAKRATKLKKDRTEL